MRSRADRLRFSILLFAALALSSCAGVDRSACTDRDVPDNAITTTLVYIVHADGDYLYHDARGRPQVADRRKVREAIAVATSARTAEVFIFHQQPRRKLLWLFPYDESTFEHYRAGHLIARETYTRFNDSIWSAAEARLLASGSHRTILLYFGHEIPPISTTGYDASDPDRRFGVDEFAAGIDRFRDALGGIPFDVLVLSTCYSGTPMLIDRLKSSARSIVASPDNLHLSYIDTKLLKGLDTLTAMNGDTLAHRIALNAFTALAGRVQTAVTIGVYDTKVIDVTALREREESLLDSLRVSGQTRILEYTDCGDSLSRSGVEIFYRPPKFGRNKTNPQHSGWECVSGRSPAVQSALNP
jgi:hypothetical protein